ncbi:uncharacterized protein LOC134184297 isoform X2 [Corticium candelabrum]|uniref:uncharacterized protein LOC134184297 isoform X2 n=1 Tax=Corticium candelabrum TaxID=121492 RepID=UPI002E2ED7F7|nr:uncharacterized protein LOC134184297 isoform X2 [Corticium candelabrum]
MECLPDELIVELMTFLEPREVCRLSATCKKFRRIGREPCIFKHVSFKNCIWITRKGLSLFLSQYGTLITSLSLRQCHHIGGNTLNQQKETLRSLRDLDIVGCGFNLLEIIKAVVGLKELVNLKMDGYAGSSNCWTHTNASMQESFMAAIARLCSLTVYYQSVHAVSIMNHVLSKTKDRSQLMSYTAVLNPRHMVSAARAPKNLTSVEIYSYSSDFTMSRSSATGLSLISDCLSNSPRLKTCCLSTAAYSGIPVTISSNLPFGDNLRSLRLAHLSLNDSVCSVIAVAAFELEELDLSWSHITSDGLVTMSAGKISCLKKLWLSHTNLFYTLKGESSVDGLSHVLERAFHLGTLDISGQGPCHYSHVRAVHYLLASQTKLKNLSIPPELFLTDTSSFSEIISNVFHISLFSVSGTGERFPTALLVGTGNILSQVVQWKHLESLTLSWIPAMRSSVGLVNVAQHCYCLRQLCIKGVGLPGHSSTLAPLAEALKHCKRLEIFCLEQKYFNFSLHFGDCLSACTNLKLCHLNLLGGRVDLQSVLQVLERCSCLMGFALFSGMKTTDCKRLLKSARSIDVYLIKYVYKEYKE